MRRNLVWLRDTLRLADNPAFYHAAQSGQVLLLYLKDESPENDWPLGEAALWWHHQSLQALQAEGIEILFEAGDPLKKIPELVNALKIDEVYVNQSYTPYGRKVEAHLEKVLPALQTFNASYLFEPGTILNKQGSFFKVFTPFWKACLAAPDPREPYPIPEMTFANMPKGTKALEDLKLVSHAPHWSKKFQDVWTVGPEGALERLQDFIDQAVDSYKKDRDFPSVAGTSKLSPYLAHGNMSPHQIWQAVLKACPDRLEGPACFLSELGWREFSANLLYHFLELPTDPFQEKFANFPWGKDEAFLKAWQQGQTGYPLIDAGMRELWATGTMHNRVRMLVASFLTKHCLIPWQEGERWFWDTLVDADLASNAGNWQWVAGCGADAAPYFRIFNPVTQSIKFDKSGTYIRQWVPELSKYDDKQIHEPWRVSPFEQKAAGCVIGKDYPRPIVDLSLGRERALNAYKDL